MNTTADWHDTTSQTGSMTRPNICGGIWARRKVSPEGTVTVQGRSYRPKADVQLLPIPGEWLSFSTYFGKTDIITEWTAPADPDGFIRRVFWEEVTDAPH